MIAHECPICYFNRNLRITDYQYALFHLFEKNEEYYNHFKKCIDNNREVFLDNSAFEFAQTGEQLDENKFVDWCNKLNPTVCIVPDVMNDGAKTILKYIDFNKNYPDIKSLKMGIIHGNSYHDFCECYKFMSMAADYIGINHSSQLYLYIGKGNTVEERQASGRIQLIKMLIADGLWNWNKPHHLLGMSIGSELSFYKNNNIYNIRSIDTSNPIMAGMNGLRYNGNLGLKYKPKGLMADHINDQLSDEQINLIEYNVECFKKAVN